MVANSQNVYFLNNMIEPLSQAYLDKLLNTILAQVNEKSPGGFILNGPVTKYESSKFCDEEDLEFNKSVRKAAKKYLSGENTEDLKDLIHNVLFYNWLRNEAGDNVESEFVNSLNQKLLDKVDEVFVFDQRYNINWILDVEVHSVEVKKKKVIIDARFTFSLIYSED